MRKQTFSPSESSLDQNTVARLVIESDGAYTSQSLYSASVGAGREVLEEGEEGLEDEAEDSAAAVVVNGDVELVLNGPRQSELMARNEMQRGGGLFVRTVVLGCCFVPSSSTSSDIFKKCTNNKMIATVVPPPPNIWKIFTCPY